MSRDRSRPGASQHLMPHDKHYGSLRDQPIRGDVFTEGGNSVPIRRDWVGRGVRGITEHPTTEGDNPIGLHLARDVRHTLPGLAASAKETLPRTTKIGLAICADCGERSRKVDPELGQCADRVACAKRAEKWR